MKAIKTREQFREYRERYLVNSKRDRGGAWNRHAINASRYSDQLTIYGREMVQKGRATVTQAIQAMPDEATQRRLADSFYYLGTREQWSEALHAIHYTE